ncbi:MAG: type II toxin-antitoxin system HicA family toxin, partial [bacterium]|nr:type II toxin-antitoxin system HicA family toxin [bacterium]
GFVFERQKGSHRLYSKEDSVVTVAYHNKTIKPKTLRSIIRQFGLDQEQFTDLL